MHGGLVSNTKVGKEKSVKMGHMSGLIEKTTGEGVGAILSGILVDTKPGRGKVVDSVMKSNEPKPKTMARSMGQVPYAGKKY
jgi:hypothetical protein